MILPVVGESRQWFVGRKVGYRLGVFRLGESPLIAVNSTSLRRIDGESGHMFLNNFWGELGTEGVRFLEGLRANGKGLRRQLYLLGLDEARYRRLTP